MNRIANTALALTSLALAGCSAATGPSHPQEKIVAEASVIRHCTVQSSYPPQFTVTFANTTATEVTVNGFTVTFYNAHGLVVGKTTYDLAEYRVQFTIAPRKSVNGPVGFPPPAGSATCSIPKWSGKPNGGPPGQGMP